MASDFVEALCILTKPVAETNPGQSQSSQHGALLAALESNLDHLELRLRSQSTLQEAARTLQQVREQLDWYGDTVDLTWRFVQQCLLLLLGLTRHLTLLMESYSPAPPNPRTSEAAPPLPPDVLSVAQQKVVTSALQFVVTLGLCPYLAPGVGVALAQRSAFGATVKGAVGRDVAPPPHRRLLITVQALLQVSELPSLGTLVLTRHLADIMAGLCQLGHQPAKREAEEGVSIEERVSCRKALQDLLGQVYQPIVIKELLVLQGARRQARPGAAGLAQAPPWLRRLCGQLLSERLVQPHGVRAVVRAILEGPASGEDEWRKCDAVARILAACPQQSLSPESYYSQVCPQVLDLLHISDKLTALQFQRVATSTSLAITRERPEQARRYLLAPLVAPLTLCGGSCVDSCDPAAVEERGLTRCVEDLYKICVVGNSASPALLQCLRDVVPVLFSLYCFTKQNVSHLRAPCQEVLLWYLKTATSSEALTVLKRLCSLDGEVRGVTPGFEFTPGSEGGVKISPKNPASDEDDALYEKVSGEQWRVECLVQMLAEMKESDLPGDFFLDLLKELTELVAEGEEESDAGEVEMKSEATELLRMERRVWGTAARRGGRLALLQVLAAICEGLPPPALLRQPAQVVAFVEALLQRACASLSCSPSGMVETQSLSMGMGLVATLLAAPAELSHDSYSHMGRLLAPLEHIAQQHPEPVIQELASDLRVALLTHGAVCSDAVAQAAQQPHAGGPKTNHSSPREAPATPERRTITGSEPSEAFSECLLEACDPDVPTRAAALRSLSRAIQEKDAEALHFREKVCKLLLENLEHEDPFVYLSAIQGLAVLADAFPEQILQRLLEEYEPAGSHRSSQPTRSLETRLKVGEVLMRASRALGDLAPHYGRPLIAAFLRGTRDEEGAVRASSLSSLGELCQRLNFSLGPLAQELSSCLVALIHTEKQTEVRRAAVHVITLLLRGLSDKTTEVLADVLVDLYRALKWVVRRERDEVTVLHAQLALEELDDVMRRFIFPTQTMEKKIVVLP